MLQGKKIPYMHLIPFLLIVFIIYKLVISSPMLSQGISFFISLFSYLFWALAIAYLLNPLMKRIDRITGYRRWLSLIILYILVISVMVLTTTAIAPRVVRSIGELIEKMPDYVTKAENWLTKTIQELREYDHYGAFIYLEGSINAVVDTLFAHLNKALNSFLLELIQFTSKFFKFLIGLIISIYLLKDKERFVNNTKRIMYALLDKEDAASLISLGREIDNIFSRYIIGRALDSFIIGILCYIGLAIMNVPFAILFAIIVGVTNMIPYFGPFIGMVPTVFITFLIDPLKALWVAIFILLLQQFDGWYLGPKILGVQLKMHPLWVIIAITVGGQLRGVLGMFVAVPILAVCKTLLDRYTERKLLEKKITL